MQSSTVSQQAVTQMEALAGLPFGERLYAVAESCILSIHTLCNINRFI